MPSTEPSKIAQTAKAVLGALVAFAGALAMIAADPKTTALLPQHWTQWLTAAAAGLIALGGVFGIRNARTREQAQRDLDEALNRTSRRRRPAKKTRRVGGLRHPSAPHPGAAVIEPDDDEGQHRAGG